MAFATVRRPVRPAQQAGVVTPVRPLARKVRHRQEDLPDPGAQPAPVVLLQRRHGVSGRPRDPRVHLWTPPELRQGVGVLRFQRPVHRSRVAAHVRGAAISAVLWMKGHGWRTHRRRNLHRLTKD